MSNTARQLTPVPTPPQEKPEQDYALLRKVLEEFLRTNNYGFNHHLEAGYTCAQERLAAQLHRFDADKVLRDMRRK